MTELKPCPVCGSEIEEGYEQDGEYWVACEGCGFEGGHHEDPKDAFEDWNNHLAQNLSAEIITLQAENEKLREGLKPFAIHADISFSSCEDDYPLSFIDIEDNSISAANITVGDLRKVSNLLKGGE